MLGGDGAGAAAAAVCCAARTVPPGVSSPPVLIKENPLPLLPLLADVAAAGTTVAGAGIIVGMLATGTGVRVMSGTSAPGTKVNPPPAAAAAAGAGARARAAS